MPGTPTPRGYTTLASADAADIEQVNVSLADIDTDVSALEDTALPAGVSPYFRAWRTSAASLATGATVIFNAEEDPNGWYDASTGIFLPTTAGVYRVSFTVFPSAPLAADKYVYAYLKGQGGTDVMDGVPGFQRGAGVAAATHGSGLLFFDGSVVSVKVALNHDVGGSLAIASAAQACHFEAEYVGAPSGP